MVSAMKSGSSGPGSSPGRAHCVVFFDTQLQCLSPPRCINRCWRVNAWGEG